MNRIPNHNTLYTSKIGLIFCASVKFRTSFVLPFFCYSFLCQTFIDSVGIMITHSWTHEPKHCFYNCSNEKNNDEWIILHSKEKEIFLKRILVYKVFTIFLMTLKWFGLFRQVSNSKCVWTYISNIKRCIFYNQGICYKCDFLMTFWSKFFLLSKCHVADTVFRLLS